MRSLFSKHPSLWLWVILLFALALRIVGIGYGLPLMLVADEQPFILGALKMLELHTVLPAHHIAEFVHILYYPPYLSYLYLLPFGILIGIKYLLWHGAHALFVPHMISNLTAFFVTARMINVLLGVASIYLVYKTAYTLFQSRRTALISSFLLATSITHIALSMTSRHWTSVTFLTASVLFVLTHKRISEHKRYGYALLIAGMGMGISTISALLLFPIGLHFVFLRTTTLRDAFRSRFLWCCAIASIALALLPSFLYPKSNGFIADLTAGNSKPILDFLASPFHLIAFPFLSEPVLIALTLGGLILLWRTHRRFFYVSVIWISFYSWVFYFLFRFETRFFLPLFPLFALLGGYACARASRTKFGMIFMCLLLLVPLAEAFRFSSLSYTNDTRIDAREWVLEHVSSQEGILVYANPVRIPTTADAIQELSAIDSSALRKVDEAEMALNNTKLPHALNLYTVNDNAFFHSLPAYVASHHYNYLLLDTTNLSMDAEREAVFMKLMSEGTLRAKWDGMDPSTSIGGSSFTDPFWRLFSGSLLGPNIVIYQLHQ